MNSILLSLLKKLLEAILLLISNNLISSEIMENKFIISLTISGYA